MKTKVFLASLALTATLTACGGKDEPADATANATAQNTGGPAKVAAVDSPEEVTGIGRVEPEGEIIPLASMEPGVVTKVMVKQGDKVAAGTVLLELDHDVLTAQIEQGRRRLTTQAARIKADEKSLQEAQIRLNQLKANAGRTEALVNRGAETGQNLFDQKAEIQLQENSVQRWQAVLEGDRAQVREIEGEIGVLNQQLLQRSVRAPLNGTILTFKALMGSYVTPQISFGDFAPDGKRMVRCEIDELFASAVRIGQKATITGMGSDTQIATGQVVYASEFLKRKSLFSEQAGEMEDRRVREVHVLLDTGADLLINSRVECHINTAKP
ncbi:MAG: efflux RND transporter periplasmic adaptor subunit [Bacteroidia bacterium]